MRPSPPLVRLTPGSAIAAGLLSVTAGAGLTAVLFSSIVLVTRGGAPMAVATFFLAMGFAWPIWLIGLAIFGAPCWWLMHRSGVRSPWIGGLAGAGLTFMATGAYVARLSAPASPGPSDTLGAWLFAIALAAIGGGTGWLLIRIAYTREAAR
ncbi:MAG: hypothetical protein J7521_08130 [Caulobacter sp.]|nr:hypothetical protein [Caulobacter sp.]